LENGSAEDQARLAENLHYLTAVGRVESVKWASPDETAPESATALLGEMKLLIPLYGLIDKEAELSRLSRELDKKASELDQCERKLANAAFVDKAPAVVVEKEQIRAAELKSAINSLKEQQQRIQSL
jgi:valyl-tRNA synthetase